MLTDPRLGCSLAQIRMYCHRYGILSSLLFSALHLSFSTDAAIDGGKRVMNSFMRLRADPCRAAGKAPLARHAVTSEAKGSNWGAIVLFAIVRVT